MNLKNPEKLIRTATTVIVVYLICAGAVMAFFPLRPFWNDEWRLIYNIKFKTESQLWGTLDLLQECPRVYLLTLKKIMSGFDYSYISMRLPALVTGILSILLCFHLRKKIFPHSPVYGYLFVLILVSSQTFTDYLVQVKQYEMEILLCLLALWQLVSLLEISEGGCSSTFRYLLLCVSFMVAPFFSYTYPIAFAPVVPLVVMQSVVVTKRSKENSAGLLLRLYVPVVIAAASIVVFYLIDVRKVMADASMYRSYTNMLGYKKGENHFVVNTWDLFALVGSGFIFEIIFGMLGILSMLYAGYRLAKTRINEYARQDHLILYCVLLLLLTLALIFSGRLIGSVARICAYTVPSISILIVSLLCDIRERFRYPTAAGVVATILFAGLFGNLIVTGFSIYVDQGYHTRISTYWNVSEALKQARLSKMPILITDGVRANKIDHHTLDSGRIYRNSITADQIAGADVLCAEVVVKVNPEYKVWDSIPVYYLPEMKWTDDNLKYLPADVKSIIACDGVSFVQLKL